MVDVVGNCVVLTVPVVGRGDEVGTIPGKRLIGGQGKRLYEYSVINEKVYEQL